MKASCWPAKDGSIPVELGATLAPDGESRFYGRVELPPEPAEKLASFLPSLAFVTGAVVGAAVAFYYYATEADDEDDRNLDEPCSEDDHSFPRARSSRRSA